ncbi:GNAT family N-acetyltransferase [Mycolicibacterium sp. 624]|uniref:GNAT family N-acetyltransferase n=1 Tax=Mycolicibacterium sp. 624 TaxID=3156314 RepID=UPI003393732E
MPEFSPVVADCWLAPFTGDVVHSDERLTVVVNPSLDDDERVTVLWTAADDRVSIALTPAVAGAIGLRSSPAETLSENGIRAALAAEKIVLHGADNIFCLTESAEVEMLAETDGPGVRRLTGDDVDVFASFEAATSEQDRDDASVELDHWAVFGAFDEDSRLVSAASMYPWDDESTMVDLGVLTRTSARGRGYASKVVRAMFRYALAHGHEPQYRCQVDNTASVNLAASLGLHLFGRWETVTPADRHPDDAQASRSSC